MTSTTASKKNKPPRTPPTMTPMRWVEIGVLFPDDEAVVEGKPIVDEVVGSVTRK